MELKNLHFFDSNGYDLNFEFNDKLQCWEGSIFLPKVSVGLYANTTIYVLEEVPGEELIKYKDINEFFEFDASDPVDNPILSNLELTNTYFFPQGEGTITFAWDTLNKFVDEFFMFNFDTDYVLTETSALVYTPNDGPDCNPLIINTFDTYEVPLDNEFSSKALPIHVAFMANEKYDATTYNRTLVMSYEGKNIARIKFFAETVEEDERLKIWNANLGYNITPEDTMIFYKSDIKEYRPDYILLNEKRKELMLEGSNIYPYIGSYKAIINAIKFFGYDNLNIIEYWRNVNPTDENFGKIYHSSRYSLTKKETLTIGARNIVLPNKDYRKINALALVYDINKPTGEIDDWELPKVKEQFAYTIEEALIKLFALRKKLNKEFMPGTSRIIDIIGEAHYFGIHGLFKVHEDYVSTITNREPEIDFELLPGKYTHITDNEYFDRYINFKQNNNSIDNISLNNIMLSDIFNTNLNELGSYDVTEHALLKLKAQHKNKEICDYYLDYYREAFVDHTIYKAIKNNDDYPYMSQEYEYTGNPFTKFSGKVVLKNTSFQDITFEDCELKFGCMFSEWQDNYKNLSFYTGSYKDIYGDITFGNIDTIIKPDTICWTINMSKPDIIDENGVGYQVDEDMRDVGIYKTYEYHDLTQFQVYGNINSGNQPIETYNKFFAELPYVGYYDVTMKLGFSDGNNGMVNFQTKTKTKYIKVEPYQIEIIGFYYDARAIPENLQSVTDENSQIYNFVQNSISHMHGWASAERATSSVPKDCSMPYFEAEGSIIGTGPYYNDNMEYEWYLADHITYEMSVLKPLMKYTRYIRNGVDVKPYTWFLLGYEYSKITGKVNPKWTIKNNTTGVVNEFNPLDRDYKFKGVEGKYFTLLLKKEGNYTVTLDLEDKNGNKYTTSRNIIVVSKTANYKLYQPFKKDYDFMVEQDMLRDLKEYNTYFVDDESTINYYGDVDVSVDGTVFYDQDFKNVKVDGFVSYDPDETNVDIIGFLSEFEKDEYDVNIEGQVISDVLVDINARILEQEVVPVDIDSSITDGQETIPVDINVNIDTYNEQETIPVDIDVDITDGQIIIPVNIDADVDTNNEQETVPVDIDIDITDGQTIVPVDIDADVDTDNNQETVPVDIDVNITDGQTIVPVNVDASLTDNTDSGNNT